MLYGLGFVYHQNTQFYKNSEFKIYYLFHSFYFDKCWNTEFLFFVIFLFSVCIGGIWNCTDHDCPGICIS